MDINVDYLANRLTIEGPAPDVARAKDLLVQGAYDVDSVIGFDVILPLPLNDGGYDEFFHGDKAAKLWGCWGDPLVPAIVQDTEACFSVTFDTARSAPEAVAQALSAQVPGATVSLDCVHSVDPSEVSASGRWVAGHGALAPVEPSREHYAKVKPTAEDWLVEDLFPEAGPTP